MEHATLIAPFDGVVANLFSKPYNPANTAEAFCTIIDSKGMKLISQCWKMNLLLSGWEIKW